MVSAWRMHRWLLVVAAVALVWGFIVFLTGGFTLELAGLRVSSTHGGRPLWIGVAALVAHYLIAGLAGLRADVAAAVRVLASRQTLVGFMLGATVVGFVAGAIGTGAWGGPSEDYQPLPVLDLEPKVLHDGAEIRTYLNAFPDDQYKPYFVAGLGRFYIDDRTDLIKRTIASGEPWERHMISALKAHIVPGTAVLEVGAHIGTHTVPIAHLVRPWGRVYAFEPQRKIYRELHRNLSLNGVTNAVPLRFAIGAGEARVVEMNPASHENEGGTAVGAGGDRVELRTLDSFGFERVSLIKIDVEGYENEVLDGAVETLRRNRPVVLLEIIGGSNYESATPEVSARIRGTWKKLEALGYRVKPFDGDDYIALPHQ